MNINILPGDQMDAGNMLSFFEAVQLNNQANRLLSEQNFAGALKKYQRAIALKESVFGPRTLNSCISLSGLCDAYIGLGDLASARREATRMLQIAQEIDQSDQVRIARELLADIAKAEAKKWEEHYEKKLSSKITFFISYILI